MLASEFLDRWLAPWTEVLGANDPVDVLALIGDAIEALRERRANLDTSNLGHDGSAYVLALTLLEASLLSMGATLAGFLDDMEADQSRWN